MTYETYENNPALEVEDTDYYSESELELVEEDEESFEWTPDVSSYEELDYGDDATQFVTDEAPFVAIPNPIINVDGELWNASEYAAYKAELAYQADQESKRAAHIEKLAWQARMRRGLPTESRLGRIKRIQSDKEAKDRKFICAANAKKAPKFGTRRNNAPTRKGKRGVVVVDAKVVSERRKERRRVAKAAQALRACTTPQIAVPIAELVAYIPKPEAEDEDEQEVAALEQQEIQTVCSVPKTWVPVARVEPTSPKTDDGAWITVKKTKSQDRKLKKEGFVTKGTRGRAGRCTVLDLSAGRRDPLQPGRPVAESKQVRDGPEPCPAGWVFTHPCMDLRPHINDTTPLCRHFQFGTCNFGSSCKFRHTYGACKFGARCTRAGCKRAHPPKKTTPSPSPSPPITPTPPPPPSPSPPITPTPPPSPSPSPPITPTPPPSPSPSPSPSPPASAELMPLKILEQLAEKRPLLVCDVIKKVVAKTPNWPTRLEPEFNCVLQESGGFVIEPASATQERELIATSTEPAAALVRLLDDTINTPPGPPLGAPPPLVYPKPTRTCKNWAAGKECKFGTKCHFAHFTITPTRTCKFWAAGQVCKHGSKCRFKHG
jgi:hypothetical protein